MSERIIIIRYGELHLKGKNRGFFEKKLIVTIKKAISKFACDFVANRGRYIVSDYELDNENNIIAVIKNIFGIHSVSIAQKTDSDLDSITKTVFAMGPTSGTFKVITNRANKNYPMNSNQVSAELGYRLLQHNSELKVDLHNPQFTVHVDIRENGEVYVYSHVIKCRGGMPVGTSQKGLLLLSGGIDSPVAGYMMAKRGMTIEALHFHSYPHTSEMAKKKVIDLAKHLTRFCGDIKFISISITAIQEAIHKHCSSNYMITILRRCMMKLAELVAKNRNCKCIINGESLGQVASQTMESLVVTNSVVSNQVPIFRPLIGYDKSDIVKIAEEIETYLISILPYEDCCTVFLPDSPVTKPTIDKAELEESKIVDLVKLLDEAYQTREMLYL